MSDPRLECPCEDGKPDPCPKCGASVADGVCGVLDAALRERETGQWQAIATCPPNVTRALICWPAFALNADFEQSDIRQPENDLVSMGFRASKTDWECDMVIEHFEDEAGFGYGEATHWMPLPSPPVTQGDEK